MEEAAQPSGGEATCPRSHSPEEQSWGSNPDLPGPRSWLLPTGSYLFHGALHNLLLEAHLDSDHERSGAADSGQKALGDDRDVGVCPAEGVKQRGGGVDTLRQGAGDGHRERESEPPPGPPCCPPPTAAALRRCRCRCRSGSDATLVAWESSQPGGQSGDPERLRLRCRTGPLGPSFSGF